VVEVPGVPDQGRCSNLMGRIRGGRRRFEGVEGAAGGRIGLVEVVEGGRYMALLVEMGRMSWEGMMVDGVWEVRRG